jgi:polysaccharide deacetylase 2 family uncharacterized protein YibQ
MGKTQYLKNTSILLVALGVLFITVYLFIESGKLLKIKNDINLTQKRDQNKTEDFSKVFEINKTLDKQYQSVASQIEAFIKEQRATRVHNRKVVAKEENLTNFVHKSQNKTVHLKKKNHKKSIPKLAIIMDDVGFEFDIEKIKQIPYPITPSIFPPNEHYPDTPNIAKMFKHYMVHFPMEAYKYKNIAEEAIKVSDKIGVIDKKIKKMKKDFPNAVAINNHTGSKFTCDFHAMEQFFTVLNRYDIQFIDSRTASGSRCQDAGNILKKRVLQRDVFLDNKADEEYIKNQLKIAVEIAKKNGHAIAICHPRELTFKVLMESKDIFKGVKLVYVDELM